LCDDAERRHRHHHFDQAAVQAESEHCGDSRQHRRADIERQRSKAYQRNGPKCISVNLPNNTFNANQTDS
jgi:hypothetical protein